MKTGTWRGNVSFAAGVLIIFGMLAFELFNFGTTEFGLERLFNGAMFAGLSMASILAVASCAVDLAGVARVFTPERGKEEPIWVWILLAAWLLAALINAGLTWWAVNLMMSFNTNLDNALVNRMTLIKTVPVVIAVFVFLIRVSIIGAVSVAGEEFLRATPKFSTSKGVLSSMSYTPNTPGGLEGALARYRALEEPVAAKKNGK